MDNNFLKKFKNLEIPQFRPVLVGLSPGRSSPEPLDTSGMSGGRLRRWIGAEGFDLCQRVNLYPDSGHRTPQDRVAAREAIEEVVRGSRVVALGREVARDMGAPRRWFEWGVCQTGGLGYIGCSVPHPGGRSRFWNERENRDRARGFLSMLARPCIHVEGPDGSGKSRLAAEISRGMGLELVPTVGPTRTPGDCVSRITERCRPGIVSDRSSGLISELVYGPVLRGGTIVGERFLWTQIEAMKCSTIFIYCRIPRSRLDHVPRPGEDQDHLDQVQSNIRGLVDRYDEVFSSVVEMGATVVLYDWTKSKLEVMRCAV